MELLLGDIVSTLKKNLGIRSYDSDSSGNLNIGANTYDSLFNISGTGDPATGAGLDGTVIHEAYITEDGEDYVSDLHPTSGTHSAIDTTIAMSTGAFGANMWVKCIGTGEKMWVTGFNAVSGILTVVRGQLGTTAAIIKPLSSIAVVGDLLNEGVYSKPHKNAKGYWTAIKCISGDTGGSGVRIQANNLGGDNLTSDPGHIYTPVNAGGASPDWYIAMQVGDIYYGKFNRVSIDEPGTTGGDNTAKVILYKG